jgi:hypothetical protein
MRGKGEISLLPVLCVVFKYVSPFLPALVLPRTVPRCYCTVQTRSYQHFPARLAGGSCAGALSLRCSHKLVQWCLDRHLPPLLPVQAVVATGVPTIVILVHVSTAPSATKTCPLQSISNRQSLLSLRLATLRRRAGPLASTGRKPASRQSWTRTTRARWAAM